MTSFLSIDGIWESGPLVRIDHRNLPDLDVLMLDVYQWCVDRGDVYPFQERFTYTDPVSGQSEWYGGDIETLIPDSGWFHTRGEAQVSWFRKNPCVCGEGHKFDVDDIGYDEDREFGKPDVRRARGAFMGVYFL